MSFTHTMIYTKSIEDFIKCFSQGNYLDAIETFYKHKRVTAFVDAVHDYLLGLIIFNPELVDEMFIKAGIVNPIKGFRVITAEEMEETILKEMPCPCGGSFCQDRLFPIISNSMSYEDLCQHKFLKRGFESIPMPSKMMMKREESYDSGESTTDLSEIEIALSEVMDEMNSSAIASMSSDYSFLPQKDSRSTDKRHATRKYKEKSKYKSTQKLKKEAAKGYIAVREMVIKAPFFITPCTCCG
jgi:hypothetical protein